jgi:undecaprenyl-diphosphatase
MMYWNHHVFLLLNAPANTAVATVWVAQFAARWLVFLAMLLGVRLWIWGAAEKRGALIASGIGAAVGLGINQLLGLLWFEPRPFMIGLGHTLMRHDPDNSFPSDHATFLWSLGFGLIATCAARQWGALVALAGVAVAWARIYLGVHFPVDMVASFAVALVCAAVARALVPVVQRRLLPVIECAYEAVLRKLCLTAILPVKRNAGD